MNEESDASSLVRLLSLKKFESVLELANKIGVDFLDDYQLAIVFEAALIHASSRQVSGTLPQLILYICNRLDSTKPPKNFRLINLLVSYLSWGGLSFGNTQEVLKTVLGFVETLPSHLKEAYTHLLSSFEYVFKNDITSYVGAMSKVLNLCNSAECNDAFSNHIGLSLRRKTLNYQLLERRAEHNFALEAENQSRLRHDLSQSITKNDYSANNIVLMSVDVDYFIIFSGRLQRLARNNPEVLFTVVLLLPNGQQSVPSLYSKCTLRASNINIICVKLGHEAKSKYFKTYSCCIKYIVLPEILKNLTQADAGILMLDIDLSLDGIDISKLIQKCSHDQVGLKNSVQTFLTSSLDFQSSISAGFLYASAHHATFYEYVASYIEESLHTECWDWGLDPAALIIGMSKFTLLPIKMPVLNDISPGSRIFEVDSYEQAMKASCRVC